MNAIRSQILFDVVSKRLGPDVARELMNAERALVDHLDASGFTDAEIVDHLVQLHRDYSGSRIPFAGFAAGRWVLLIAAALMLSSCSTSSTRSSQETVRRDTYHVRGALNVPVATETGYTTVGVPVEFTVEHDGSESLEGSSDTKTQLDLSALSGVVIAGLKQAFPILSSLGSSMAPPAPPRGWGDRATEGGLALAAAVTAVLAARERARASAATRRADEHEADADRGWNEALARGAPPDARPPRPSTRSTKPRPLA